MPIRGVPTHNKRKVRDVRDDLSLFPCVSSLEIESEYYRIMLGSWAFARPLLSWLPGKCLKSQEPWLNFLGKRANV